MLDDAAALDEVVEDAVLDADVVEVVETAAGVPVMVRVPIGTGRPVSYVPSGS